MVFYPQKNQMIREIDEEIASLIGGTAGASRFIKVMCRNRISYLYWARSRIEKNKDLRFPPASLTNREVIDL